MQTLKAWLLKKAVEYLLQFLAYIPEYFATLKRKREELEAYKKALESKEMSQEKKDEAVTDFLD